MSSALGESLAPNGTSTAERAALTTRAVGTRVEGEHPAILEVGAGEVDLDGADTGFGQSFGHDGEFLG